MPTLGHQHSVFLRASGGKGIATAAGAALALTPLVVVITLVPWLLVVRVRMLMRYAPLLGGATYLTASFMLPLPDADRALAVAVCASCGRVVANSGCSGFAARTWTLVPFDILGGAVDPGPPDQRRGLFLHRRNGVRAGARA